MLIDTHCHLDFPEFNPDREEVIRRAQEGGIGYMINIGSTLKGSRDSVELAGHYDCIYASVGIHPHDADGFKPADQETLAGLAKQKKVVAIGETGLDYYKNCSLPENQRRLFIALLELAKSLNLAVVIHSRQAEAETLAILKEHTPPKAVVHCFSGDKNFLRQCLDLGFFISFTANLTYKKAQGLRDTSRLLPLERLMLETDAPFLSPEGLRGRRNEPAHLKYLAQEIARLKECSLEKVAEITTQNAKSFFGLS